MAEKEYIEREAALRVLCDACGNAACPKGLISRCSYYEKMQSIPAADVRPVVLCKDCKNDCHCMIQDFMEDYGITPDDQNNFFCGFGEREKK
ncbi:MAG: hypothetical protein Q3984_03595 [Eubacteriales bacterium]|nr:hypothetical protein [Eubacteriales bacterium]